MINILRTVVSRVKRMSAEGRFSVRCAENCGNDRLHRREVNVYMPYIRQLAVTKTVVMAMKTVVHGNKVPNALKVSLGCFAYYCTLSGYFLYFRFSRS